MLIKNARKYGRIYKKKEPPKDADEYKNVKNKYDKFFQKNQEPKMIKKKKKKYKIKKKSKKLKVVAEKKATNITKR